MTMSATNSSPAPAPRSAEKARQELLHQHECIRYLLDSGLGLVAAAIAGDERAAERLPGLFAATREMLEHHLEAEEALLLPIFADDLPSGSSRVDRLRAEHGRQRKELRWLADLPLRESVAALARRYRNLGLTIIAEMEVEEENLLARDVVRDVDDVAVDPFAD